MKGLKQNVRFVLEKLKGVIAPFLQKIAPSSIWFGPPKGFYSSPTEYMLKNSTGRQFLFHKIVAASEEIAENPPVSTLGVIQDVFLRNLKYQVPEQFVLEIFGGRVVGKNCYIIAPNDRLIGGLSREFKVNDAFHKMSIFRSLKLPTLKKTKQTVGVVGYPGGAYNYFHWMFDVLPRIGLLEKAGMLDRCDRILINKFNKPFHRQTINMFGIPQEKFIFSGDDFHLQADHLLVPSIPEHGDLVPQWSVDYLKKHFRFDFMEQIPDGRRVYISRSMATNRRINNEQEILPVLEQNGFEVCMLESMTIKEQAAIFFNASIIIAPHGASQVNLIFCRPGTKLIEIFSPQWINCCYWILSNKLSLQYSYLVGNLKEDGNKTLSRNSDITVQIPELKKILESNLTASKI